MLGCYHRQRSLKKTKIVCNKNLVFKAIQMIPICLTNSDYDFILDEIKLREKIEYKIKISADESCE